MSSATPTINSEFGIANSIIAHPAVLCASEQLQQDHAKPSAKHAKPSADAAPATPTVPAAAAPAAPAASTATHASVAPSGLKPWPGERPAPKAEQ